MGAAGPATGALLFRDCAAYCGSFAQLVEQMSECVPRFCIRTDENSRHRSQIAVRSNLAQVRGSDPAVWKASNLLQRRPLV